MKTRETLIALEAREKEMAARLERIRTLVLEALRDIRAGDLAGAESLLSWLVAEKEADRACSSCRLPFTYPDHFSDRTYYPQQRSGTSPFCRGCVQSCAWSDAAHSCRVCEICCERCGGFSGSRMPDPFCEESAPVVTLCEPCATRKIR